VQISSICGKEIRRTNQLKHGHTGLGVKQCPWAVDFHSGPRVIAAWDVDLQSLVEGCPVKQSHPLVVIYATGNDSLTKGSGTNL